MNVALIRPNHPSHLITPHLGLGYLASYARARGHEVRIVDGLNAGMSRAELIDRCRFAEVVGITCLSAYFLEVIALTQALKGRPCFRASWGDFEGDRG
jgi:hypothetical protein